MAYLALAALLPFLVLFFRGLADATVLLVGAAFLLQSWRTANWGWAKAGWFRANLVLWGYLVLVSTPLGLHAEGSLAHSLGYIRWPLFAAATCYWVFSRPDALALFSKSLLAALLFIMLDSFWQLQMGADLFGIEKFAPNRLTGPMRGPVVGALTLRLFDIALAALALGWVVSKPQRRLPLAGAFLALGLAFFFVTGERMTFLLAVGGALMVMVGAWLEHAGYRGRILAAGLATLILLGAIALAYPLVYQRGLVSVVEAVGNFSNNSYAPIFSASLEVWRHFPLTGTGLHNYADACAKIIMENTAGACQRHAHNSYLQWLAEAGVIGLALFGFAVGVLLKTVAQGLRGQGWLMTAAVTATLFTIFWPISSAPSFFNNWFGAVNWLAIGWLLAMSRKPA